MTPVQTQPSIANNSSYPTNGAFKSIFPRELQDHLSPEVKARLADIVNRLSRSLVDINFGLQNKVPTGEFDKRVIGAFLGGCLEFSVLLLSVHELFFHNHQFLGKQNQIFSILEKLVVDLRNSRGDLVGIAQAHGSNAQFVTGLKAGNQGVDEGQSNG